MPSAIEGKEWEELCFHYRQMSQATGAKKPSGSKEAKALRAMKAPKDGGEEYDDPARKEDIWGRTKTRLDLWKNISKTRLRPWQKRCKIPFSAGFWVRSLVASRGGCNGLQYCGREGFAKDVGRALLGRRLALPGPVGRCAFAHLILLQHVRNLPARCSLVTPWHHYTFSSATSARPALL